MNGEIATDEKTRRMPAKRGRKRKSLNRPMKNAIYPVYPEDKPRILAALKARRDAFLGEKCRNEKEELVDQDRQAFLEEEIREHEDLIDRLADV